MFAVLITEPGADSRRLEFDKGEVTIGRRPTNDIVLPKANVSPLHARIAAKDGRAIIVDLQSTNGTYVNGDRITKPTLLEGSDRLQIGDFVLAVEGPTNDAATAPVPAAPSSPTEGSDQASGVVLLIAGVVAILAGLLCLWAVG